MALNPFQQAISNLARELGLRGSAETQVYQRPEFSNLVNRFFGAIPLPAGINDSMVRSRSASGLTYLDPEGYEHILERNLNALDPRLGQVSERSTNRPAVLPTNRANPQIDQILNGGGDGQFFGLPVGPTGQGTSTPQATTNQGGLIGRLNQLLSNPVGLSTLDPKTMELLAQMKAAEDQALQEQFERAQGTTTAQLVGSGVGASSIAGDIMARLLKEQGSVKNQAQANQASRELGVQQFLTGANQDQARQLQAFITDLLGQGTQRDIASAGNETQRLGINNQNEQAFASLQEQIRQFNEQLRMQERQNFINNLFKGVSAAASVATGIGGLFGGAGAGSAFGGNSLYLTPPFNPYGNNQFRSTAA